MEFFVRTRKVCYCCFLWRRSLMDLVRAEGRYGRGNHFSLKGTMFLSEEHRSRDTGQHDRRNDIRRFVYVTLLTFIINLSLLNVIKHLTASWGKLIKE